MRQRTRLIGACLGTSLNLTSHYQKHSLPLTHPLSFGRAGNRASVGQQGLFKKSTYRTRCVLVSPSELVLNAKCRGILE